MPLITKCKQHHKYQAKFAPRPTSKNPGGCKGCWSIYNSKVPTVKDLRKLAKQVFGKDAILEYDIGGSPPFYLSWDRDKEGFASSCITFDCLLDIDRAKKLVHSTLLAFKSIKKVSL